jgi:RNA polymerase sigma-70 factor (ECF subfamily)
MAGDLTAFEQVVRQHQQSVWRFLRRLLGDAAAAEDVTQETFLRVHRRLPSYGFRSSFTSWVFQIARNAGIDELRARARRDRLAPALAGAAGVVPAATGRTGEARAEIDAALATLTVDLREALLLVEVLGLPYAEAASVLAVPVGTVKSRVFTARLRLAAWARAGEDDDGTSDAAERPPARAARTGRAAAPRARTHAPGRVPDGGGHVADEV